MKNLPAPFMLNIRMVCIIAVFPEINSLSFGLIKKNLNYLQFTV